MNTPKKYTLTIPDLTMEEARKIADDIYGSMMWGKGENGETLVCYARKNPVAICEQIPVANARSMVTPGGGTEFNQGDGSASPSDPC